MVLCAGKFSPWLVLTFCWTFFSAYHQLLLAISVLSLAVAPDTTILYLDCMALLSTVPFSQHNSGGRVETVCGVKG